MTSKPQSLQEMIDELREQLVGVEAELASLSQLTAKRDNLRVAIGAIEKIMAVSEARAPVTAEWVAAATRPKPEPSATLPWTEYVRQVLEAEGRPLHIGQIIDKLKAAGFQPQRSYESYRGS